MYINKTKDINSQIPKFNIFPNSKSTNKSLPLSIRISIITVRLELISHQIIKYIHQILISNLHSSCILMYSFRSAYSYMDVCYNWCCGKRYEKAFSRNHRTADTCYLFKITVYISMIRL